MIVIALIFIAAAVFLIVMGLRGSSGKSAHVKLPSALPNWQRPPAYSFLDCLSFFTRPLLEKTKLHGRIQARLDTARIKLTAEEFFNLKIILVGIVLFLGNLFVSSFDMRGVLFCLAFGLIFPEIILHKRIAKRKHEIVRYLPEVVDLLGLCVEVGLDFTTALRWVLDRVPMNATLEEFSGVLEEIKWGKSRNQALKDMAKRVMIPEITSFVQLLSQSEKMGTSVADSFMILAEDSRMKRLRRGERLAIQAPMKILIPLIFCILPVIGIIIGGPIFLQFMQGGIMGGFK
ncbi:MAG: type II secretion system F family protein [Candidatus Omnitrophica bacterium]|nr:type II secretion system F family protein [Candidatus Omnitrophota bacterium]